jgi:hypothetical protein
MWRIATMKQQQSVQGPSGNSWQFFLIIGVIVLGVIGLVGKSLGLF